MRIALHTCCGPCLIEPHDALAEDAERLVAVYANPNIHPMDEYERRRDTLRAYAAEAGIEVVELEYDTDAWEREVGIHADTQEQRCRACYRLRLRMTARWAADNGFDAVATTLSVSPYQDPVAIAEEGAVAAGGEGLEFLARDFRDRYPEATRRSREMGMYRQNYCGCRYSAAEAQASRDARKAARMEKRSKSDPESR